MSENHSELDHHAGQAVARCWRQGWSRVVSLSVLAVGMLGAGVVLGQADIKGNVAKAEKFKGKEDCWTVDLHVKNGYEPVLVLAFDKNGNVQGFQGPNAPGEPSEVEENPDRKLADVIPVAVVYEKPSSPARVCYKIGGTEYCVNS